MFSHFRDFFTLQNEVTVCHKAALAPETDDKPSAIKLV